MLVLKPFMTFKTIVTGGSGLAGRYLSKIMPDAVYLSSKDYDLTSEIQVQKMFDALKPTCVIHLAARVGGIIDNMQHPADYFLVNTKMNTLLVEYAYKFKVDRFIGVLSSCIYPDALDTYPIKEDDLHKGPPTPTNFSYGYAKRNLAVQIDAYNQQYNLGYQYVTPCNLFGAGDKTDERKSHFVAALIKKIVTAKKSKQDHIVLFGDGTPIRQFMHAGDFAGALKLLCMSDCRESFNICGEETLTIAEIAATALQACDAKELKIIWDSSKPNGQLRKDISSEKFKKRFPDFKPTVLEEGIRKVYLEEYDKTS